MAGQGTQHRPLPLPPPRLARPVPRLEHQVRGCVARLRVFAGTDPDAPDLTRLAGELLLKRSEFARLWERYDVKGHSYGRKTFHHPEVGDLTLGYQSMEPEGTFGHRMVTSYAEPGTADHDAMVLLDLLGQEKPAKRMSARDNRSAAVENGPASPCPDRPAACGLQPNDRGPVAGGSPCGQPDDRPSRQGDATVLQAVPSPEASSTTTPFYAATVR
ncbi:hypothetical protein OG545_43840 [Streptomyces europaeiscabiei]